MEASTRKRLRPARELARKVLLPPLLAGLAILCLLLAVAISFGQRAKADNPLIGPTQAEFAQQLTLDLEGTPTPADIARAQKPLSERRRLLAAHPYYALYRIAKQRFGVSSYLVAAVHYQDTGFGKAPKTLADRRTWRRHRYAMRGILRPTRYPNRAARHPSVRDDFDVVMAIAAGLKAAGARNLGPAAQRAVAARYGNDADGGLATAMVVERARAWRLLGTLPLPGNGELATPAKGVVGGCGYFGCPRPGHLHNGVDFLAPTGTPIHAADHGVVASVESPGASGGYGNFVCIQHRPHLATCYAHMSTFAASIRPGARVRRGQVIGLVGSTGSSSAPHLHFEVRRGPSACSACAVDPLPLLSGDVPNAVLPVMTNRAPLTISAATSTPALPAAAPAAAAPAPVPEADANDPAPADRAPNPRRNRSAKSAPTGGALVGEPLPPRTALAPATTAPPPPAVGGTGGVTPDVAPTQPPAPPPPAQPPPPPPEAPTPAPALTPAPPG